MIMPSIEYFNKSATVRYIQNQWDWLWLHLLDRNDPSESFLWVEKIKEEMGNSFLEKWELEAHSTQTFCVFFLSTIEGFISFEVTKST